MNLAATVTMVLMLRAALGLVIVVSGVQAGLALHRIQGRGPGRAHDGRALRTASTESPGARLGALPEVAVVTYVSKEQALADFKAARSGRARPTSATSTRGFNPFPA